MKTLEDVMHEAAKAADLPNPLPESFKNHEQAVTYYRALAEGYKTLWMDEVNKNTKMEFWKNAYFKAAYRRVELETLQFNNAIQNRGDKDIPGVTICDPNAQYCDKCNWQLIDTVCPHCYPDVNFRVESL